MWVVFDRARRRCVAQGSVLALVVLAATAVSTLAGPAGLVCPRSHDPADCPVEHPALPPLDEPLVPREVPSPFRTAVQQQLATQFSPVEATWHLSIVRSSPASRTVPPVAKSHVAVDHRPWQREPWERMTLLACNPAESLVREPVTTFGHQHGTPICGDFNGDGRSDLGVYIAGEWFIDLNGNRRWDEADLYLQLGAAGDQPVTGDWNGDGKTDVGVFGPRWDGDERALEHEHGLPDVDNPHGSRRSAESQAARAALPGRSLQCTAEGATQCEPVDYVLHFGALGDRAVVGDFNGDGIATVGVYRAGRWLLDVNGDGQFDATDKHVEFGTSDDLPVVADIDGEGRAELGIFSAGQWRFDLDHNGQLDERELYSTLGRAGDRPLVEHDAGVASPRLWVYRHQLAE